MAMDMELITPQDNSDWVLDIDIIKGFPKLVDPENTPRQRAAVAAFMALGSVPGNTSIGVNWGGYNSQQVSLVDVDNQVKKSMQSMTGDPTVATQLIPLYDMDDKGEIGIRLWDIQQQKETAV